MDIAGKILVAVVLVGLGALSGYTFAKEMPADAPAEESMHAQMNSMTTGLTGLEGSAFDYAFATEMITHHEGAIAMARMAQEKSENADVRALADSIIAAQESEITRMKSWVAAWEADASHVHEGAHPQ